MFDPLFIKWVHILSATLLFGTGLGSAFYKYMADRGGDLHNIALTNKAVVRADWVFTAPTIIVQPATGIALANMRGYSLDEAWLVISIVLYIVAGVCWLVVVYLQISMRTLSVQALALAGQTLPGSYYRQANAWFWLGVPAFISIVVIFFLMIFKPV